MTISVTMLTDRLGEDGSLWTTGNAYSATEDFARSLVHYGFATASFPPVRQTLPTTFAPITAAEVAAGVGVAGQSYRISDGAQTGRRLVFENGAFVDWTTAAATPDTQPNRWFLLGDSITNRQYRVVPAGTVTVDGTDVSITWSGTPPPVGSYVRVYKQVEALNIDVPVVSVSGSVTVVRYPFDVSSLWSGVINCSSYAISNDSGWPNYVLGQLAVAGKAVQVVRNASNGGSYTSEARARVATEIAPLCRPGDIVAVMIGVNDIERIANSVLIPEIAGLMDDLLALGLTVHFSTITQPGDVEEYYDVSATAIAQLKEVNGYIRARCLSEARMKCFDSYAAMGGADAATAGFTESSTGIHPTPAGAAAIGARYVADCGEDFRKASYRRWLSTVDNYADASSWNLLANCEFAGATGVTPPTSWTLTGNSNVFTLSARADGAGNDLLWQANGTGAGPKVLQQDITSKVSVGDRLIFGVEFESEEVEESHYFTLSLEMVVNGATVRHAIGANQHTYAIGGRVPPTGTRWFFEKDSDTGLGRDGCLIPEGTTSVLYKMLLQQGAAADPAGDGPDIVVSRPHCYKV